MKTPTQNNRGTTLVELIVCMALLGLFSVATVMLIQPASKAFTQMQQQTRAQNLADSLIERLRGEVMQASGYVRITNADTTGHEGDIFELQQSYQGTVNEARGSALEFGLDSGYIELIDAGSIAETHLTADKTTDIPEDTAVPGYVHLRYYMTGDSPGATYPMYTNVPKHRAIPDGKTEEQEVAYNYTEAYPKNSYMNMTVELEFTVRGHSEASIPYGENRVTVSKVNTMAVLVTVKDEAGSVICSQKGVLVLPHEPNLVQKLTT